LTRTTNSGQTFAKISGVTYCGAIGFGKEAPAKTYPTVFIYGTVNGILGVHRSTDEGATWIRVNNDAHEYGGPGNGQFVQGDMNVFGRVYMSTVGRGLVYGESDQTCIPTNVIPYIKVNAEATKKLWITTVNAGSNVLLSPEPVASGTWSWSGPEGFSSTSREITFTGIQPAQAGIYKVTYTNASGCQSSVQTFTVNVTTEIVTGIRHEDPQRFQMYPNPTASSIIISDAMNLRSVTIRDIHGRQLSSVHNEAGSANMSLEYLPAGIYLIELVDYRGTTSIRRVVKK
jgi:xyloglucan-specific exo-beta-1,4-glucanase